MPCLSLSGCYKDGGARIPKEFKHSVSEVVGIGKTRAEEKSSEEELEPVPGE